jgi:hypothetical protein
LGKFANAFDMTPLASEVVLMLREPAETLRLAGSDPLFGRIHPACDGRH